jgi:hypothetical protein
MKAHFLRLLASVGALVVVTFGFASGAGADQPTREPLQQFSSDIPNLCSFTVHLEITANNEYQTTFVSGQQLITGALKARVTNNDTHVFVDLNISGPIQVFPQENRVVSLGPSLWTFTDPQPGLPRLAVTYGRLEANTTQPFTVTSVSGRVVDVCALLS